MGGRAVEESGVEVEPFFFLAFLDPEKEDTYDEGLLVAKWAQIYKTEPSSHFFREGCHVNRPLGRSQH